MNHSEPFQMVQTGTYHKQKHLCCQDSTSVYTKGNITLAAVSDGCGSAVLSHIGSALCVRTFIETFAVFPENMLEAFCTSGKFDRMVQNLTAEAIQKEIDRTGVPHQLLSATLVGCICYKKRAVFVHAGDGFAARVQFGHIDMVSPPENDGSHDHTFFITSPLVQEHIRITRIRSFRCLLLSTDGLSRLRLQKEMFLPDGLANILLQYEPHLSDDCGVVLLTA